MKRTNVSIETRNIERNTKTDLPDEKVPRPVQVLTSVGATVTILSLVAFAALQYLAPVDFPARWGELNHNGVLQFQRLLFAHPLPPLSGQAYALLLRILLITSWLGYGVCVAASARGGRLHPRRIAIVIGGLAVFLAVLCPPSFSVDAYGYLAHARLQAIHGLNPYFHKVGELRGLEDPVISYIRWDVVSPYGPLWTLITWGIAALLRNVAIWIQIIALKLIAAAALIVAALVGKRIADHLQPGKGFVTLLAIGLNPLFLIEGPANGHNDVVMISLLLIGILFYLRKNYGLAVLFTGFSAAIKLITIMAIPWICGELWARRRRLKAVLPVFALALLGVLPVALAYAPFWQGAATLAGVTNLPTLPSSDITGGALSGSSPQLARFIVKQWPLLGVFLILSIWVVHSKKQGRWMAAWIAVSGYMALFTMGPQFPWYLIWPLAVSLTRWNRPYVIVSSALSFLSLVLVWMYSVVV